MGNQFLDVSNTKETRKPSNMTGGRLSMRLHASNVNEPIFINLCTITDSHSEGVTSCYYSSVPQPV
jgi:cell division ATPase FtsA